MLGRIGRRLRFELERLLVRGPLQRLGLVAVVIALISLAAGALAWLLTPAFDSLGPATWWAFLRLSDPGYLGEDEGVALRTISTAVTVLGYVVFLGALVAIMTQWLDDKVEELQSGLSPIAEDDHVLVLGWTSRTAAIVEELMLFEARVRRFLATHGESDLHVVILAEDFQPAMAAELRDRLGDLWDPHRITFRSGSPVRVEHLRRVDFLNAAVILVPSGDPGVPGRASADDRLVKTLLTTSRSAREEGEEGEEAPLLVAEVLDSATEPLARAAYSGRIELVAVDRLAARLVLQAVRHPGLSAIHDEILRPGTGNEILVREPGELLGRSPCEVAGALPKAVVIGSVRPDDAFRPAFAGDDGGALGDDDRLVVIARSHADARVLDADEVGRGAAPPERGTPLPPPPPRARRILVLGWSPVVPVLVREAEGTHGEQFVIEVLDESDPHWRRRLVERRGGAPSEESAVAPRRAEALEPGEVVVSGEGSPVEVRQVVGDPTEEPDLRRVEPASHDAVIVLGHGDRRAEDESDARTLVTALVLQRLLHEVDAPTRPRVLVELTDAENDDLVDGLVDDVLVTPLFLSHVMTQVALRRELGAVFDEVFGLRGPEVLFRAAADFGLSGRASFREVQRRAAEAGAIALGWRGAAGAAGEGLELNPGRDAVRELADGSDVVLLAPAESTR